ncbi:hypothetical protein AMS68_001624 [Peltaster fructicola]|uniref:Uncharacterized protein n=1 Tax=Peltaster fructicola TaxID=286661 RepID=A0A6H0XMY2_9PEZI|nr:hypothetical protein AMS68_001624 [Peltaster fructicola]
MAETSIGSIVFVVAAFLLISLLVLLLLRHYLPLRTTPGYLLLPVFLALALPCSIILLVPIDLASSDTTPAETHQTGIWLPERALQATWRITYWLTFVLTWAILPILGEYCDSGDRDSRARILYSLKTNAKYQLLTLGVGTAGFVYFVFENGFHLTSLRGLVMALAYAWGLFLAIGLMGHGLVTLPRRLFKSSSIVGRLKHLQGKAPLLKERLDEAIEELGQLEYTVSQLQQRKNGVSRDNQEWIDELADTCAIHGTMQGNANLPAVISERYLAELTRKLKRARHKKARFDNEWTSLCGAAQDTQAIIDAASTQKLDFARNPASNGSIKILTPTLRFYVHTYIIPYSSLGLSVLLAFASVGVIWSEIVSGFFPRISLVGLTTLPSIDGEFSFINQLIAAAWLLYMCTTALYALSDVKVWGNRALVRRQTYGESACWYALQVAKLTVPLSYNFVTMMPSRSLYQHTGFYKLLGQYIDITPLGKGFSAFFPCFILVTAAASLFNLWSRASNVLGFGILEDGDDGGSPKFGSGSWREGRTLIQRELQAQQRQGTVRLTDRGSSLDVERQAGEPHVARPYQQPRTFNTVTNEEEEEEEDDSPRHFYQDLGERIKNTFDTAETPQWLKNIGSGIKSPRWLQRDQRDDTGNSALSRWFGGRPEDGRVRL